MAPSTPTKTPDKPTSNTGIDQEKSPDRHQRPDKKDQNPQLPTGIGNGIKVPATIDDISPSGKALALMGARYEIQTVNNVPAFAITYLAENEERVINFIKASNELVLPTSPNPILHTDDGEFKTRQVFAAATVNARHLHQRTRSIAGTNHAPINISVPKTPSTVLKLGGTALAVDPNLKPNTTRGVIMPGFDSAQRNLNGPIEELSPPKKFSENYITANSLEEALRGQEKIEDIKPGNYDVMIIDISRIGEIADRKQRLTPLAKIADNLKSLIDSSRYHVITDDQGNLVVLTKIERGGNALGELAIKLFPCAADKLQVTFGKIDISKDEKGDIHAKNYPNVSSLGKRPISGLYIPKSQFHLFGDRDSTDVIFEKMPFKENAEDPNELIPVIVRYPERAGRRISGPRKTIGLKEESATVEEALSPSSPVRLLIIEGKAGTAKSRLLTVATQNNPNTVVTRISESSLYTLGKGAVHFAEKLFLEASKIIPKEASAQIAQIQPLRTFIRQGETKKLRKTQTQEGQREIEHMCVQALTAMAAAAKDTEINPLILGVDDNHFIDQLSVQTIANIKFRYLRDVPGGKVALLERPEQEAEIETKAGRSPERKLLEKLIIQEFGPNAVQTVCLQHEDGSPKVDFNDPDIALEYTMESLSQTHEDPQSTIMGKWYQTLGQKVGTGFEMNTAIKLIKPHIKYDPTTHQITVTEAGLETVKEMPQTGDLQRYLSEKLEAQELNESEQDFIADLAACKESLTLQQLLFHNSQKYPNQPVNDKRLEDIGFIKIETLTQEDADDGSPREISTVSFFHPNLGETIRDRMPESERAKRTKEIHRVFRKGMTAEGKRLTMDGFIDEEKNTSSWHEYEKVIKEILLEAQKDGNHNRTYEVANQTLGNLDFENPIRLTTQYLKKMAEDDKCSPTTCPPAAMIPVLQEALQSFIKGCFYKGQFEKIHLAIDLLLKLEEATMKHRMGSGTPTVGDLQIKKMLRIGYDAAYTDAHEYDGGKENLARMHVYKQKLEEIEALEMPTIGIGVTTKKEITNRDFEQTVIELQKIYREEGAGACYDRFKKVINPTANNEDQRTEETGHMAVITELTKEEHRQGSESIKLRRLMCRVGIERISQLAEYKRGVDGNAVFGCPEALDDDLTEDLLRLDEEVTKLMEDVAKNPTALNLIELFALKEIEGQIWSYKCRYQKGAEAFGTEWLEASRVGSNQAAVRAALLGSTTLYTEALIAEIKRYPTRRTQAREGQPEFITGQVTPRPDSIMNTKLLKRANRTMDLQAIPSLEELSESDFNQVLVKALRVRGSGLFARAHEREFFGGANEGRQNEILEELKPDLMTGIKCLEEIHEYPTLKNFGTKLLALNIPEASKVGSISEMKLMETEITDGAPKDTEILLQNLADQLGIDPNTEEGEARYKGLEGVMTTMLEICYFVMPYGDMVIDEAEKYGVINTEKADELRKNLYLLSENAAKFAEIFMKFSVDQEKVALLEPLRKSRQITKSRARWATAA